MFSFDKVKNAVIVTGGTGFLGRHVCDELVNRGYNNVIPIKSSNVNRPKRIPHWTEDDAFTADIRYGGDFSRLFNKVSMCYGTDWPIQKIYKPVKAVINLAASVGGIGANQTHSAEFMHDSLLIGLNVVETCRKVKTMQDGGKLVQIGTVCAYPKHCSVPFKETDIWNGYPEETNAPYGIAKKTIMELVRVYNTQYAGKFNGINLIPVNLYGPGDNFDYDSSHVIPALIRKFETAREQGQPSVQLWGTGQATREFLYVKDAAKGIVDAMERYEGNDFINLGSGSEIKIEELAKFISNLVGYHGQIMFDPTKPDGQPRRQLDVSRAFKSFGFKAKTNLETGLVETIQWFRENRNWYME